MPITIHDRGQALEDQYFRARDAELMRKLRESAASEQPAAEIAPTEGVPREASKSDEAQAEGE